MRAAEIEDDLHGQPTLPSDDSDDDHGRHASHASHVSHASGMVFAETMEDTKQKVREALAKKTYNVFDLYHEEGYAQAIARSSQFENVTLFLIGINGIWIAYDTDYNSASSLVEAELQFLIAENIFCFYFLLEWIIRFLAFRNKCDGIQDGWFVFDSFLVLSMVVETWVITLYQVVSSGGKTPKLGFLRLFRLFRLARMARMLRSMPELMILINGMLAAMRSVFFVMCLLIIIMYVFAIIFTQLAKGTVMGHYYFPNIQHSMYSLLIFGTFLDNLAEFCDEVGAESYPCLALVFVFILLASCTVLNMLIGVLCEVVSAVADVEKEEMNLRFVTDKLHNLLFNLDEDRDGFISKAEFLKILGFPEAVRALEEVEIDPVAVVDFADYIFGEGKGRNLSFDKFMDVLLNLRSCNIATIKDVVELKKHFVHMLGSVEKQIGQTGTRRSSREQSPGREAENVGLERLPGNSDRPSGVGALASESDAAIKDLQIRTTKLEDNLNTILQEFRSLVKHIPDSDGLPRATVLLPNKTNSRNADPTGKQRPNSETKKHQRAW